VDRNGWLRDDGECERTRSGGGYYGGYYGGSRWVYGGSGGTRIGEKVLNFRTTPTPGARVTTPTGRVISRGGFGSAGGRGGGFFGG
jgi:hypothetical protein